MDVIIYHNPRCSKSRKTLEILEQNQIQPIVVEYLSSPPNHQQLDSILRGLDMQPMDLIRRGEEKFKALQLDQQELSRDQLIEIMIQHPRLIERPIVVAGHQVVIGRPPEAVLALL